MLVTQFMMHLSLSLSFSINKNSVVNQNCMVFDLVKFLKFITIPIVKLSYDLFRFNS